MQDTVWLHTWYFLLPMRRVSFHWALSPYLLREILHLIVRSTLEAVLVLASCFPCWSASSPFGCSGAERVGESSSSYFAQSSCPVCLGLVQIPSSWTCHEGVALAFWFRFDCSLQSACHQNIGSNRSRTCRPVAKYINMGRSWTGYSRVVECRSWTSDTTHP